MRYPLVAPPPFIHTSTNLDQVQPPWPHKGTRDEVPVDERLSDGLEHRS